MQTQIDHLPFAYQKLLAEFKAEKDALEASELDYVKHPVVNNKHDFEQLDSVIDSENADDFYDENDENTYDMNAVSPYMRNAFGEFDEDGEYEEVD